MNQSTIKQKMESVIEVLAGYVTHFEINGRENAEEYIEKSRVELRDFARLICQEMVETFTGVYGKDEMGYPGAVDWRPRATISLEQKAQEILKALE